MAFIEKNWILIAGFVMSGLLLIWPFVQRRLSTVKEMSTQFAVQLINRQNAVLLDVREPAEVAGGKLPNAVHIPLSQLAERGAELAKLNSRPVVIYCAAGQRSGKAAGPLEKLGFTSIYQLQGGVKAWKDAGLPLVDATA